MSGFEGRSSGAGPDLTGELGEYRKQLEAASADARGLIDGLTEAQFNWHPAPGQWSIAECLDHLAVTGREMAGAVRRSIDDARSRGLLGRGPFRHGMIGNMIVRSMEPPAKRKFKAPEIFRPRPGLPLDEVARGFFATQDEVMGLIREADGVNLARAKVASPVTKLLKLSLGQALALILTHERRHLWQAARVKNDPAFPRT
jgi:hypothetical protein